MQFRDNSFSSTDGEEMHMLLFDIVPLHNDALLVSFNEVLYPFKKEAFRLLTKPWLHCVLDVTMRAEVLHLLM
jgi:hypothetical protein